MILNISHPLNLNFSRLRNSQKIIIIIKQKTRQNRKSDGKRRDHHDKGNLKNVAESHGDGPIFE